MQEAVINELKSKTRQVKETRLLKQDEVYNGALEDILLGKSCNLNQILITVYKIETKVVFKTDEKGLLSFKKSFFKNILVQIK